MLTLIIINTFLQYLNQDHGQAQLILIVLSGLIDTGVQWLTQASI